MAKVRGFKLRGTAEVPGGQDKKLGLIVEGKVVR